MVWLSWFKRSNVWRMHSGRLGGLECSRKDAVLTSEIVLFLSMLLSRKICCSKGDNVSLKTKRQW